MRHHHLVQLQLGGTVVVLQDRQAALALLQQLRVCLRATSRQNIIIIIIKAELVKGNGWWGYRNSGATRGRSRDLHPYCDERFEVLG